MSFNLRRPPSLRPKYDAYPYQLDAVRAVMPLPYAAIFHEQGLGKTKIAIDLMLLWLGDDVVDTVFVVTKKMLVRNWIEELATHSHVTPSVLSDDRRSNSLALNSPVLVYVLNYEVVATNIDIIREFLRTCRVGAILDESQKIKNPEARLTICFHSIAAGFERRVIMTGTPSANRPYDIWSQIKFLDDGHALGNSYAAFREDHDLPGSVGKSDVGKYARRLAEIMDRIRNFSVRETKQTAGIQLPDKVIRTHFVELAPRQAAMYRSYRDSLACELGDDLRRVMDDAEAILKRLLRLVQCASNPGLIDDTYAECPGKFSKLAALVDMLERAGEKAVVWTKFVDNVEWLADRLKGYVPQKVHGRMSMEQRNESIRKFKTCNACRLLIATPASTGYLSAERAQELVADKIAEISKWKEKHLASGGSHEAVAGLKKVEDGLNGFQAKPGWEKFTRVGATEMVAYQEVFGVLAEVLTRPAVAKRTIETILKRMGVPHR